MKAILTTLALLAAPLASPVALAQSDGTLGSSSTGTFNFNVNISDANRIQIFGFRDRFQTIEAGQAGLEPRSVGLVEFNVSTPTHFPCITADLPDTTVTLDWSVTPLADGGNVVPFYLQVRKDLSSTPDQGVLIVQQYDITTGRSGTVAGVGTRLASPNGHGNRCIVNTTEPGRFGIRFGHSRSQTIQTPGTYVSTVTFTVKPE